MSTPISVILSGKIDKHIAYLAQLSNRDAADLIASILNGAFKEVNRQLNVPDIVVEVTNAQTTPQVTITLPEATLNYLNNLFQPNSQRIAPELITIFLPQEKDIPNLLSGTILSNLTQFSSQLRAERRVSKLSDSDLLALIAAKGQLAVDDPVERYQIALLWGVNLSQVQAMLRDWNENMNRHNAAKAEAFRRGLIKFSDFFL
ncbi:MAG: hypothetical protein KF716_10185 [Anaerolineae bacterium]|nr:hypothetical protein [Anaerolineae bacterium]